MNLIWIRAKPSYKYFLETRVEKSVDTKIEISQFERRLKVHSDEGWYR